jgi:hypothetical protein
LNLAQKLSRPIVLKDGRTLDCLADVRYLILKLPSQHQAQEYWQHAAELLMVAGLSQGASEIRAATEQLVRALKADGLV